MGEKLSGVALAFIGITDLVASISLICSIILADRFFKELGFLGIHLDVEIRILTTFGWILALFILATGLMVLAAGIAMLTKPK